MRSFLSSESANAFVDKGRIAGFLEGLRVELAKSASIEVGLEILKTVDQDQKGF